MKKYILFLMVSVITLSSCGSGSTTNVTTDSTTVKSDSVTQLLDSTKNTDTLKTVK